MNREIDENWGRFALIVDIAARFDAENITLGKTALQKVVFLLERVFGLDFEYDFTLYNYGPYCQDLDRDLEIVQGYRGVTVQYDASYGGYRIKPSDLSEDLLRRGRQATDDARSSLNQLISDYGRFTAKELELRSTIIYLASAHYVGEEDLMKRLKEVKPHFSWKQIETGLTELKDKGYLTNAIRNSQSAMTA